MQQDLKELFINQHNSLHLSQNPSKSASGEGAPASPQKKGNLTMSVSIRSSTVSRFAVAVAAIWMCGAGAAWAGGGGESLTTLQAVIGPPTGASGFCHMLGMGTNFHNGTTCPQLPTFTQAILEAAGLENSPPEMVAAQNGLPPGNNVYASNPPAVIPLDSSGNVQLLNATTMPTLVDLLSTVTPLAFISGASPAGPTVTLSTNATTAAGNTTLHFATTQGLETGQAYSIADTTTPAAIPSGTILSSFTPTTVTMSANAASPGVGSGNKITLTPIANPAAPVQLYDSDANTFLYAVAAATSTPFPVAPGGPVPDTLYLFYEDLSRDNQAFNNGQIVAKFSLPLTVLNSAGAERPVMLLTGPPVMTTTLTITSCTNGPASCFMVTAAGDFKGNGTQQTLGPASCSAAPPLIGINCAVVFGASPTSSHKHAIFELTVPLLVTGASPPPNNTDPAYFYSLHTSGLAGPINLGIFSAFLFDDLGVTPAAGILDSAGTSSIGIAPTAGPLGPSPSCTPTPPATTCTPPAATFALCASLPDNSNGPGAHILPGVAAYYAIATNGGALLSAALSSTSVCPAF
jgi:hypothetical protein